jgi:hypothetical protein
MDLAVLGEGVPGVDGGEGGGMAGRGVAFV